MNNTMRHMDGDSLQNLHYFSRLTQSETHRVREMMRPYLDGGQPGSREAMEQMIRILGELGARVSVIEQAAEQQLLADNSLAAGPLLYGELTLPCNEIDGGNLYDAETDGNGERIRWTRSEELSLRLPLFRNGEKRLRVYFGAIIKSEYSRSLQILIDGAVVTHKVRKTKQGLCLECRLPKAKNLALTNFTLRLPAVHSPAQLGGSSDQRMLGIAIRQISVEDAPATFVPRLLRR
ncbi:MAG: hypothetical protein ACPW60_00635 [Methylohalobius sp. ZOD2]